MIRQNRKLEHLNLALEISDSSMSNGMEDIIPLYNALPELNMKDIDSSCFFLKKPLNFPFFINAITGGHPKTTWINKELSFLSGKLGIAMAVGSQKAGLVDNSVRESFSVVRKANPKGVILANLGAFCTLDEAKRAVEMIEADALQLHLNVSQEIVMQEGDRNFKGTLANIAKIIAKISLPVIIKEVGFGMTKEVIKSLYEIGARYIDVGGAGGTNFASIELARKKDSLDKNNLNLETLGIPTAISLLEGLSLNLNKTNFMASGGIRNSLDILRCLILGADMVAMAKPPLEVLCQKGSHELEIYMDNLLQGLRKLMLLVGAKNLSQLKNIPVIITGFTSKWLEQRGIDLSSYSLRKNKLIID